MRKLVEHIQPLGVRKSPSTLGEYINWVRLTSVVPEKVRDLSPRGNEQGLTLTQLGALLDSSPNTVQKWIYDERTPSDTYIELLIEELNVPWYLADVMKALVAPDLHRISPADWPEITDDDLAYLETFKEPACFQGLPFFDLPPGAANEPWCRIFPMLRPAPRGSKRVVNIIDVMLNAAESARIRNRFERVWVMLFGLRIYRPLADPVRFAEVYEACARSPYFERLWKNDPLQEIIDDTTVGIFNPETGQDDIYQTRQTDAHFPPGLLKTYSLYRPAPTVEIHLPDAADSLEHGRIGPALRTPNILG
ncbi:helix-turn-helix transcriptional regulator [Nocardia amamiensis]|uniref:Helix-turn-helix transcriptional regulator n=1 Tax=Nocardia amamiensis TaxID=404578 RepID=A0ABS0D1I1_9NOCA|nr:helix-turn-helix transcriptional regulator [Nocardia amamiensis]MBF6302655.1 helix-turn-helix transcriptional regulator [Nocardia amamiensis]